MKTKVVCFFVMAVLLIHSQACNAAPAVQTEVVLTQRQVTEAPATTALPQSTATPVATPTVLHLTIPASIKIQKVYFDVDSTHTATEKRAPYGDSYNISLLERPFLQYMTYVDDLDIHNFSIDEDEDWHYISMRLVGDDPNNPLGIEYGVEFDMNMDGFGDYLVLAHPPFFTEWTADNIHLYADQNRDTAGISPLTSDAAITTDGYETLIFDGSQPGNADPDLAWVRINADENATVQFAVKRGFISEPFMFGLLSDAGLKDASKLDYVDCFSEKEAGSPVREKRYYPLGKLYAVDNTCRQAHGFESSGYEPRVCPKEIPATLAPGVLNVTCINPGQFEDEQSCENAGCNWRVSSPSSLVEFEGCVAP